jgi:purine nucleosidase
MKIWLDTDIGSDIDDAVCLAYLLAQPESDLLGISTVTGEAIARAKLASALCHVAGRQVPIFPGVERPLIVSPRQAAAPQASALSRWPHETNFPQGEAILAMRQAIRQHPGEVTLLSIGPLTNLALLFASDPQIPSLLKGLVMMCGVFSDRPGGEGSLEWNAMLDPHATAIVYRARPPLHRSVGLDVTRQVTMPASLVRQKFQAALLRPVLDFAEVWFRERDQITFHDPLAAATLFDPLICQFEKGRVTVELDRPELQGQTRWSVAPAEVEHEVAMGVDSERFFNHFFKLLN